MLGKLNRFLFNCPDNTGFIDVKMDGSIFEEKFSFKILKLTFSSKLHLVSCIISVAKTASKKTVGLICSMKFLSTEVAPYPYKPTIQPCMEYCCHVWARVSSCYLEMLDKNEYARLCSSFAASLEPLAHRQNLTRLSLFYGYYFGRWSSELAQLVPLPFSRLRSIHYSDRLPDFFVTIPRFHKDVYVNSFFPRTARLWNSLPAECFLWPIISMALSLELIGTY